MSFVLSKIVAAQKIRVSENEAKVISTLEIDEEKRARVKHQEATTNDLTKTTGLKIGLSIFIAMLTVAWGVFLGYMIIDYFSYVKSQNKEIPYQVVMAIITSGASITGLMAFVLKGIFKAS